MSCKSPGGGVCWQSRIMTLRRTWTMPTHMRRRLQSSSVKSMMKRRLFNGFAKTRLLASRLSPNSVFSKLGDKIIVYVWNVTSLKIFLLLAICNGCKKKQRKSRLNKQIFCTIQLVKSRTKSPERSATKLLDKMMRNYCCHAPIISLFNTLLEETYTTSGLFCTL